ncbi:MAG: hypothetical protein HIU91_15665 [Acidobacteria bacterium]|nr:hypothetical protein [Acidobacteriota bacterium]
MLRSFKGGISLDVDEEVVERNWSRLWSRLPRQALRPVQFRRWLIPALAGLGVAFAATSFFISAHRSTGIPSTASIRLNEAVQSIPSAENPLDTNAMTGSPSIVQRNERTKPRHPDDRRKSSPILQLHSTAPRFIASVPRGSVDPAVPFTPRAQVPAPLPLTLTAPLVTLQAQNPLQASGSNTSAKPHRNSVHRDHPMDITLAMGGMLIGTREVSSNGSAYSRGATHAVSAISSFHQQLRPTIGYRVAVSYARPDFQYGSRSGQTQINGSIYEVAGTYVIQGPHRGPVSTAVEGGAGLMAMLPSGESVNTGKNLRGAAIVGVSADIAVSKHLAIHTGYRLQIFKGPDFQSTGVFAPIVTTTLLSNEPMVGITYRFSHK